MAWRDWSWRGSLFGWLGESTGQALVISERHLQLSSPWPTQWKQPTAPTATTPTTSLKSWDSFFLFYYYHFFFCFFFFFIFFILLLYRFSEGFFQIKSYVFDESFFGGGGGLLIWLKLFQCLRDGNLPEMPRDNFIAAYWQRGIVGFLETEEGFPRILFLAYSPWNFS